MGELRKRIIEELNILSNMSTLVNIEESSLNRILSYHNKNGFIVMSSDRDESTTEENNAKFRDLKKEVANSGYSFIPVFGGYVENLETPDAVDVVEKGLLITNNNTKDVDGDFQKLLILGKRLSGKYNQESFMVIEPGNTTESYWMTPDGEIQNRLNSITQNDFTQRYFTQISKNKRRYDTNNFNNQVDRRFSYYIPKEPSGVQEARRRFGEHFYNLKTL